MNMFSQLPVTPGLPEVRDPPAIALNIRELVEFINGVMQDDPQTTSWWTMIGTQSRNELIVELILTAISLDNEWSNIKSSIDSEIIHRLYERFQDSFLDKEIVEELTNCILVLLIRFISERFPSIEISSLSRYKVSYCKFDYLILKR